MSEPPRPEPARAASDGSQASAPEPQSRRERRRLEVRDRILDAAVALFDERGFDETPVADICARADIAYGTFFNHFPAKLDLLRELADRSVRELAEDLEALRKGPGTLPEQLHELFEATARNALAMGPRHRELLARVLSLAYTDAPEERDRRFQTALRGFLEDGVSAGRIRGDVPVETLTDVVAGTFTSVVLSWAHFADYPLDERAAAAARFLAGSLQPPAHPTDPRSSRATPAP